ncbi:MAG: Ig-like domain repeat protein [Methanobrevibacter sp.]|nr:Ig-like domain repeat protein [Methanobrevibacter sp.]
MRKIAILSIFILALLAVNISFASELPEMIVHVADIEEGSTAQVSIALPSDATGNVAVSVNGQNYSANVDNGQANVNVSGLKAGDYKVKVTYEGNGNYSKVVKQADLKVSGEAKSNDTAVTTNTSANASGEPVSQVNTTVLSNLTNNTNSSNSTNHTNTSNVTPKKTINNTAPAKKPKQPKKPLASLTNKNTGLPILVFMLVTVGAILAGAFRRK